MSMIADSVRPGGAGPVRSVNTPTIAGRRFGIGEPACAAACRFGSVRPTNVANVPASDEVISIRSHCGETTRALGTLATTTLRSVMSTRWLVTLTNSALSAACLPFFGAVPSTSPPLGGMDADHVARHGHVIVTGT